MCCDGYTRMLQVSIQNVSSILDVCFKCLSRHCICCNGYTYILQIYVANILVILDVCCRMLQVFHEAYTLEWDG
jgi:hypothetical protein